MSERYLHQAKLILYLLIIMGLLGIILSPIPEATINPLSALENPPQSPVNSEPALALAVDVPAIAMAMGEETILTVTISNTSPFPLTDVRLRLPYHQDIIYRDVSLIEAAETTHETVRLGDLEAAMSITLHVTIEVRGTSDRDVILIPFKALAVESDSVIVEAVLPVQSADTSTTTVPTNESLATIPDSPVVFNLSSVHEGHHLAFTMLEKRRLLSAENSVLYAFRLDTDSTTLAQTLDSDPILVTLSLADLAQVADLTESDLWLQTRSTEEDAWTRLPLTLNKEAEMVQFAATTVGQFQLLQTTGFPQPWAFEYTPPGASAFTGSAQHSFPIATPPGIGGLTPDLTLSYNSRSVDSKNIPTMSSGFGLGWSMAQIEIVNGCSIAAHTRHKPRSSSGRN